MRDFGGGGGFGERFRTESRGFGQIRGGGSVETNKSKTALLGLNTGAGSELVRCVYVKRANAFQADMGSRRVKKKTKTSPA